MFLAVVDAHSKSPEVQIMNSTTSQSTIEAVRTLFGCYGLLTQLVSDNGSRFISSEFVHFIRSNGVKHIWSAPYHPSSNGQAEGFVQTMRSLKASRNDGRSLSHHLPEFLLSYYTTPHATTNSSTGELFLKRSIRTRFDLLRSPRKGFVERKQAEQKQYHDRRSNLWCLFSGSQVKVRNYHGDTKWIPGTILNKLGPVTYSVDKRWHLPFSKQ